MPSRGSGRGTVGERPGARHALAPASLPLCPALVLRLGLEPGLNLSALGSGPDTLPRGLGHLVPVPPAAGSPRLLGSNSSGRRTTWSHGGAAHQTRALPGLGHPTHWIWGLGWARGSHAPLDTGLEAWLPPAPPGQPSRLPAPSLALLSHHGPQRLPGPGCPGWESHRDCRPVQGDVCREQRQRGSHQGSSSFQSSPGGPGAQMLIRTPARVTRPAPLFCARPAPTSQSQAPKDCRTRQAAEGPGDLRK